MSVKNHQKLAKVRPDIALIGHNETNDRYIDFNLIFASPWKEITALLHPRGHRKPEAMQDIGEGSISIVAVLKTINSYCVFVIDTKAQKQDSKTI